MPVCHVAGETLPREEAIDCTMPARMSSKDDSRAAMGQYVMGREWCIETTTG